MGASSQSRTFGSSKLTAACRPTMTTGQLLTGWRSVFPESNKAEKVRVLPFQLMLTSPMYEARDFVR